MIYEMKLRPKYYDYIKNGTKRIELRLYDEKRKQIQIGDKIKFLKEPELEESIETEVIGLLRYANYKELMDDFDISILSDNSMTKEELLDTLQEFYTIEEQEKYGVLGIRIKL